MRSSSFLLGVLSCLLIPTFGCSGGESDRVPVYPVTGEVLVNGQPAEGVSVIFYPEGPAPQGKKMPVPAGMTDGNGEFKLTSYVQGDGAPAGKYKVAAVWDEKPPAKFSGVFEPKDRLHGRYASPQTSKLSATVEEGSTEIPPFQL